jgi:hypothetical protein
MLLKQEIELRTPSSTAFIHFFFISSSAKETNGQTLKSMHV